MVIGTSVLTNPSSVLLSGQIFEKPASLVAIHRASLLPNPWYTHPSRNNAAYATPALCQRSSLPGL